MNCCFPALPSNPRTTGAIGEDGMTSLCKGSPGCGTHLWTWASAPERLATPWPWRQRQCVRAWRAPRACSGAPGAQATRVQWRARWRRCSALPLPPSWSRALAALRTPRPRSRSGPSCACICLIVTSSAACLKPHAVTHSACPAQAALLVLARLARLGGAADERLARILFSLLVSEDYAQRPPGVKAAAAWALAQFGAASAAAQNMCAFLCECLPLCSLANG